MKWKSFRENPIILQNVYRSGHQTCSNSSFALNTMKEEVKCSWMQSWNFLVERPVMLQKYKEVLEYVTLWNCMCTRYFLTFFVVHDNSTLFVLCRKRFDCQTTVLGNLEVQPPSKLYYSAKGSFQTLWMLLTLSTYCDCFNHLHGVIQWSYEKRASTITALVFQFFGPSSAPR